VCVCVCVCERVWCVFVCACMCVCVCVCVCVVWCVCEREILHREASEIRGSGACITEESLFHYYVCLVVPYMLSSAVVATASPPSIENPKRAVDCIMLARSCPRVECTYFPPIFHALYRCIQRWLDGMRLSTSLYATELGSLHGSLKTRHLAELRGNLGLVAEVSNSSLCRADTQKP